MKKLMAILPLIWMMTGSTLFAQTSIAKAKNFPISDGTERISIQGGGGLPSFLLLSLLFRTENDLRVGLGSLIKSEDYKFSEFPETRMKTIDFMLDIRPQEASLIFRGIGGGFFFVLTHLARLRPRSAWQVLQ